MCCIEEKSILNMEKKAYSLCLFTVYFTFFFSFWLRTHLSFYFSVCCSNFTFLNRRWKPSRKQLSLLHFSLSL
uniref:Uncharacterized protein n=1 Tax=Anguilla anguilla TaxID=7936 RepID=A0A0E9XJ92_ANGAN